MGEIKVLVYDWKGSPHDVIKDIVEFMSEYMCIGSFHKVDTGGDGYAVVISNSIITAEEAESAYNDECGDDDFDGEFVDDGESAYGEGDV